MKRLLAYKPAAQRELARMNQSDAGRVIRSLESFAVTGLGDVKALQGELKGSYRLRIGKWRTFSFSIRLAASPRSTSTIVVRHTDSADQLG